MEFSLYGRYGGAMEDGVTTFKYLGRLLDQTYYEWPVIKVNIKRVKKVWRRLGRGSNKVRGRNQSGGNVTGK